MRVVLLLVFVGCAYGQYVNRTSGFNRPKPINLIQNQGFPAETHTIKTEDGYLLSVHRIPFGRQGLKPRGPVLIHHGFLGSSDSWILRDANEDLAFILADAGYDVWLANCRGNYHSKKHVTLTTKHAKFWQFSFHEVAIYDLPATIDYILKETNQKQLFYIAHSMGTLITYVLCSLKPEYNQKFRLNSHLAPVAYLKARTVLERTMVNYLDEFRKTLVERKIYEIFPLSGTNAKLAQLFCSDGHPLQEMCAVAFALTLGTDFTRAKKTFLPKLLAHFPMGSSIQTITHFQQMLKSNEFKQFDYGVEENMKRYGNPVPPKYDLSKVTAPTSLHYASGDFITKPIDVKRIASELPNVVGLFRVQDDPFNHNDFLWGYNARNLVYDPLLKIMEKY